MHHPNPRRPVYTIRPAEPADAAPLATLGAETFRDTFAHTTSAEDMRGFLAATYSAERQGAELADPGVHVFVADGGEAGLAGFAMLREGAAESCVHGPAPVQLARLYVRAGVAGSGIGHRLFERCRAEARRRGFRTLWLGVWTENHRAIRFYERHGLVDVGSHTFMLGGDAQTDRVMAGPL